MKLSQLIDAMINEALDDVHTAIPARVEKFNPQTLRGEVVPLVKRKLEQDGEPEALPPILDVPFQMPKAGPFIMRFPVRRGDTVLVVFSERALDYIMTDGEPQDPRLRRRHALDDAIAIPGLMHLGEGKLPGEHGDDAILLHRDNGVKIVLQADGKVLIENPDKSAKWELMPDGETVLTTPPHVVRLVPGGPAVLESPDLRLGGEDADEGVPLGKQLKEWLDGHEHPYTWTSGAGSGTTGPPTSPSPDPSEVVKTV